MVQFNISSPGNEFFAHEYSVPSNGTMLALINATNTTMRVEYINGNNLVSGTQTITASNGRNISFTNGLTSFPILGNVTLNLSSNDNDFVSQVKSFFFAPMSTQTVIWNVSQYLNISLWDEDTQLLINGTVIENMSVQLFCTDGSVYQTNYSTNPFQLTPPSCNYNKARFILNYGQTSLSYYRTLLWNASDFNNTNKKIWLLNPFDSTIVYTVFQAYDLLSDYDNVRIVITRNINGTEYDITGDFVDIEGKVTAYLLFNAQYNVKVISDNKGTRSMGPYYADSSGTKIVRLFDIDLVPNYGSSTGAIGYIYMTNESTSPSYRVRAWYGQSNGTSYQTATTTNGATLTVRLRNATGDVLYSGSVSGQTGSFSFTVPTNTTNATMWATLSVIGANGDTVMSAQRAVSTAEIQAPAILDGLFASKWTPSWIVFIIIMAVAYAFTIRTSSFGSIVVAGLFGLAATLGWMYIGSTTGTVTAAIGFVVLIALSTLLKSGAREM
jgi:hypothetical protein